MSKEKDVINTEELKLGTPEFIRRKGIREAEEQGSFTIEYAGSRRDLPIKEISIDLPVYRIDNGRTISLQKEYLVKHKDRINTDVFISDPYSIETQYIQHELLMKLIDKEGLFDSFKKERAQQTDPLICSSLGVVVNGNRRLCAWRTLYALERETYAHFQRIRVAVLPDNDSVAMRELEIRLQVQPDMKADYVWHSRAALIQRLVDGGTDIARVARLINIKEKEVRALLAIYKYGDSYLRRIEHPDEWSLLDSMEYALREIVNARNSFANSTTTLAVFEQLAISCLNTPAEGDRLYSVIKNIPKYFPSIIKELQSEYNIGNTEVRQDDNPLVDDDEPTGEGLSASVAKEIVKVLGSGPSEKAVEIVRNVIKEQEGICREIGSKDYVLRLVSDAAGKLNNAVEGFQRDGNMNKPGVAEQLLKIRRCCDHLAEWLNKG